VSSKLEAILTAIKNEIVALSTGYSESKYIYDLAANNNKTSKKVYAVRQLDATSSVQTNLAWTVDQEISIELSQIFGNKNDSDAVLNTVIQSMNTDIETIGKQLFKKRLGLSYVLGVLNLDVDSPLINNEDSIVTINFRATVRYRMEY